MFSILILTYNEENDIGRCLQSVAWCDDIHILDSYSTDNTIKIASNFNVNIHYKKFINYSDQRNFGLKNISYKYKWLFILDADECMPILLKDKICNFLNNTDLKYTAVRVERRDYIYNKWIKHTQITRYYIRLVQHTKVHYIREINEVLIPNGEVHDLNSYFNHYPFSKGISHWIDRHNRYSTLEAHKAFSDRIKGTNYSLSLALGSSDYNIRRFHLKGIYYMLPLRPLLKFIYMYIYRGAILDGYEGFLYTTLQCLYEYFITVKEKELLYNR